MIESSLPHSKAGELVAGFVRCIDKGEADDRHEEPYCSGIAKASSVIPKR